VPIGDKDKECLAVLTVTINKYGQFRLAILYHESDNA